MAIASNSFPDEEFRQTIEEGIQTFRGYLLAQMDTYHELDTMIWAAKRREIHPGKETFARWCRSRIAAEDRLETYMGSLESLCRDLEGLTKTSQ